MHTSDFDFRFFFSRFRILFALLYRRILFLSHCLSFEVKGKTDILFYLVVHLSRQIFQLVSGVLQRFLLHVVGRRVRQQLVKGDDVARNLWIKAAI